MDKFWNTYSKLAADVWQVADDAWKALRWNVAAAAAFAIYDQALDKRALFLGFALSFMAVCAMTAYWVRWHIGGLTPEGRQDRGILTIFVAFFFLAISIGFAVAIWSILVSLNLALY